MTNIICKSCKLVSPALLDLSTSTVQCLEISRVENLEIFRLGQQIQPHPTN